MKYYILLSICLMFVSVIAHASGFQYFAGGEYGGSALEYASMFSVNAGASGAGNAFTARTGSVSSPYWNPAGLSDLYFTEISVMSATLFADTQFTYVGMGYPAGKRGVFGIGICRLFSGYASGADAFGRPTGNFNEVQGNVTLSYARKYGDQIGLGASFRIFDQAIGDWSARGYAVDAGVVFTPDARVSYGIALQNIPYVQMGGDTAGMNLKLGIYRNLLYRKIDFTGDVYVIDLQGLPFIRWAGGIEFHTGDSFVFRAGLNTREITAGFGFRSDSITFDYAVGAHPVDFTHKIGISIRYGMKEDGYKKRLSQEKQMFREEMEKAKNELIAQDEEIRERRAELKTQEWSNAKILIATEMFENGRYEDARRVLQEVGEKDPKNAQASDLLNEISRRIDVKSAGGHFARTVNLYKQRDYPAALDSARKALAADPAHKGAKEYLFLCQAQIYAKEGKYGDAKGELFELLKINPENNDGLDLIKKVQTLIDISSDEK